jgi:hypothetical protein
VLSICTAPLGSEIDDTRLASVWKFNHASANKIAKQLDVAGRSAARPLRNNSLTCIQSDLMGDPVANGLTFIY